MTTPLTAFVRRLVNDSDYDQFTLEAVEDALNRHRLEARYLKLEPLPTKTGSSTIYTIFVTPADDWRYWDESVKFYDSSYTEITPSSADTFNGRWEFATAPVRPVTILGYSYDPYASAADLLEQRSAELSEDIASFSVYNGSFNYGVRKNIGPLEMAKIYRNKSRNATTVATFYRSDMNLV
jgi:hypothetical protein